MTDLSASGWRPQLAQGDRFLQAHDTPAQGRRREARLKAWGHEPLCPGCRRQQPPTTNGLTEVSMKIRELVRNWEQTARGRLTRSQYQIHLDLESAARLAALGEMYPKRGTEELLGELIG